MMKRILLVVVVGVSFAPAAFAAEGLMGYKTCPAANGELSDCQMSNVIANGGSKCALTEAIEKYDQEIKNAGGGESQAGSAGPS